jgi:hydroxymethylpyrimidine/phosphomethylpyrimidine kinase
VAAGLARRTDLVSALSGAKAYVAGAMAHGIAVGGGHQPLDHFWRVAPAAGGTAILG